VGLWGGTGAIAMTVNESDNNQSDDNKSSINESDDSTSQPGPTHEELFPDAIEEEYEDPDFDYSYELNKFSDLEPSTDKPTESPQENSASDLDVRPPWEQETDRHANIHTPPGTPDENSMPIIPPAPSTPSGLTTPMQAKQGLDTKLATALAIIALLAAVSAIWLNNGLSEQLAQLNNRQQQTQTHNMNELQDQEILTLKQQVKAIEQQQNQQIQALSKDVAAIKQKMEKLATSSARVSQKKTAKKAEPVKNRTAPAVKSVAVKAATKPAPAGSWVVNLAALSSETAARKELKRLRARGIKAEYAQVTSKGKIWYRIRIAGLTSKQEAQKQKELLASNFGINEAWIGKR
jgi:cell division septation protein DedD